LPVKPPSSPTQLANVRPLRRIHVLVDSADARYLRVASFLLERAGFVVATSAERETLAQVAKAHPDVVVLDGSDSIGTAVQLRSAITGTYEDVAVVIVSDEQRLGNSVRVAAKWDGGDTLVREVERAYLRLSDDESRLLAAD
jgi:CheY-like chemotaxis protein